MLLVNNVCPVYMLGDALILHMQAPDFDNYTQTDFKVYTVSYTIGDNSTEILEFTPYPAQNFTIESLLNFTKFSVYVALNNSAGLGNFSSPVATGLSNIVGELSFDKCMYNVYTT